jgi:hypothetical protein
MAAAKTNARVANLEASIWPRIHQRHGHRRGQLLRLSNKVTENAGVTTFLTATLCGGAGSLPKKIAPAIANVGQARGSRDLSASVCAVEELPGNCQPLGIRLIERRPLVDFAAEAEFVDRPIAALWTSAPETTSGSLHFATPAQRRVKVRTAFVRVRTKIPNKKA